GDRGRGSVRPVRSVGRRARWVHASIGRSSGRRGLLSATSRHYAPPGFCGDGPRQGQARGRRGGLGRRGRGGGWRRGRGCRGRRRRGRGGGGGGGKNGARAGRALGGAPCWGAR